MTKGLQTLTVLAGLLLATALHAETLLGRANHVRDGDTIVVDRTPIRLQGVAAPELKEKWIE